MDRFFERIGINKSPKNIQTDEMSGELRNSIWNLLLNLYDHHDKDYWVRVAKHIAQFFLKVPMDDLPYRDYDCRDWVKGYFYSLKWYEVYDLTEFIVHNHVIITRVPSGYRDEYIYHPVHQSDLIKSVNSLLEKELSGYRFVSGILTPISEKIEVEEIENAINQSRQKNLLGTHEHIRTALQLLGRKPTPDYRNAIKESISAIESIAKQISGSGSQGLEGALTELSKHIEIHGALKSGFIKLYGYSSDEDGIRHAILDQPNIGFTEAKYMIVSCSAFVNFLIAKADTAGLFKI